MNRLGCLFVCLSLCAYACVCVHVYLYFGGRRTFGRMCNQTKKPEDVPVGFVVGKCISLSLGNLYRLHMYTK